MQNKTLIAAAKSILKELLLQCTDGEQTMFKRLYCHKNMDATIEEAVDQMDPDKMDWAITQCENAISKHKTVLLLFQALNHGNPPNEKAS